MDNNDAQTEDLDFPMADSLEVSSINIEPIDDNTCVKKCRKMVVDHDASNIQYAITAAKKYTDLISTLMDWHSSRKFDEMYLKSAKHKMDILREIMKCIEALNFIKDGIKRENVSPFSWSPINK